MLLVSQTMLWIVVGLLAVTVIALARQIGVLHERIAPVGALAMSQGPQPGQAAPVVRGQLLAGPELTIGGPRASERLQLLFFVSPSCPVCKQLLPTARKFARAEDIDLLLVGDGDVAEHRAMAVRHDVDPGMFVMGGDIGRAFQVGKLPYAVLIDPRGLIVAQGLVNTREHLESLTSVQETGFKSVQDYLIARRAAATTGELSANG